MISVIIPNFNGAKFIPMCLDSFKNQTFTDFELIVVDNNSADDSCKIIEEQYPHVNLIKMSYNSGFSIAVNTGIKASKGDFIALFNNDAEATPNWLEELYKPMVEDATVGVTGSKILYYFRRDTIDSAGVVMNDDGVTDNRGSLEKDTGQYDKKEFLFGSCAAAILYRRKMLDDIAINGEIYDEDFFAYYEDSDINARCWLAGYKCLYVPEAVVYHIGSATNKKVKIKDGKPLLEVELKLEEAEPLTRGNYMMFYSSCNYFNLLIKNMPADFFWKKLWKTLVYEFIHYFLYSLKNGIFILYLKSKWRGFCQIPVMLKKRKIIQSKKKVDAHILTDMCRPRKAGYYNELFGRFFRNVQKTKKS
ncbi:MAG: glycosyltransferase family 2 protein [Firmicutes bacterium]|nr:glycosyltransferase family 2 protein [Bacillota bacterium]